MMTDLDRRFEVMDLFGPDYRQILSLASPQFEACAGPDIALKLAKIASDSMCELCERYADRFPAFIGTAVMSNEAAMVEGARRNIEELGARHAGPHQRRGPAARPAGRRAYMASSGRSVWNVVFASDAPFDPEGGPQYIRDTIAILDALDIDESARSAIYQDNIARMSGLAL